MLHSSIVGGSTAKRDGGLARAHWRQDHRPVVLVEEVSSNFLIAAQFQPHCAAIASAMPS